MGRRYPSKACTLESETTSATLGAEGVRTPSPMANMDFLSYPLGEYTLNNINFVKDLKEVPKVFSTNYFLRTKDGDFCTSKLAKKSLGTLAEGRVHGEYDAIATPTGKIPVYEDLRDLFKKYLDEDYTREEYTYQFTFRCSKWIEKLEDQKYISRKWMNSVQKSFSQNGIISLRKSLMLKLNMAMKSYLVNSKANFVF